MLGSAARRLTPRTNTASVSETTLLATARVAIGNNWQAFGLANASDLPDWEVTYAEAARVSNRPQRSDIGPDVVVRVRPWFDGLAVRGQQVTLHYQDEKLVASAGVVRDRSEIAAAFSKMAPQIARTKAPQTRPSHCRGAVELIDTSPLVDIAKLEVSQIYRCDGRIYQNRFDGRADRALPKIGAHYSPYVSPGVEVRAEKDSPDITGQSGPVSVKWNWIPNGGFAASPTQIKMDNEILATRRRFVQLMFDYMEMYHKTFLTDSHFDNWDRVRFRVFQRHGIN